MSDNPLFSSAVDRLAIKVEEASRAARIENPRFVEPAHGTLDRAKARRHHIVFGRRGSGKTSLLAKAAADLTVSRRPIAFVDLEKFKGHSYPDVLLSVLIDTLDKYHNWLKTAATNPANKTSFWNRLFGSKPSVPPLNKSLVLKLACSIEKVIGELRTEMYRPDEADRTETGEGCSQVEFSSTDAVGVNYVVQAEDSQTQSHLSSRRTVVTEIARRRKIDFLHRHILEYQTLFQHIAQISNGDAYLFLDDLYHIRRSDQPDLVDYFHRLTKGTNVWIKIGTIRHRTDWYRHSDPPIGVKLGDDADEIDLDLTLEKYGLTKKFLLTVLNSLAAEEGDIRLKEIMGDDAVDRLVLASGGVARDFLNLFRKSINLARERDGGPRGNRIAAIDVNQSAGEHESSKREELKKDTLDERAKIEEVFLQVKKFCFEKAKANCFLIPKDDRSEDSATIAELVDLRLVHLVNSRVTVRDHPGDIYVAYMLDLGQYAGERKRRGVQLIEFWKQAGREHLRRTGLVFRRV